MQRPIAIIVSLAASSSCTSTEPARSSVPTQPAARDAHGETVATLPGHWRGQAVGTPFGDFPFEIVFERQPDGDVHGRLAADDNYLDFRFHKVGASWQLLEEGKLGPVAQRHTLLPVAGDRAQWADGKVLVVDFTIDHEALVMTTHLRGKPHAEFRLARTAPALQSTQR